VFYIISDCKVVSSEGICREIGTLRFLPDNPMLKRKNHKGMLKTSDTKKHDQPTNRPTKQNIFKRFLVNKYLIINCLYYKYHVNININNSWFRLVNGWFRLVLWSHYKSDINLNFGLVDTLVGRLVLENHPP
jgi:hypothetical protein